VKSSRCWVNRAWNDTTNTVISGKALMQIHGDWMKGVWKGAGKEVGKDFGCINIPGTKAVSVTVDSFGILGGVAPDVLKAEEDFAATVVDPAVNAEFAFHKGSSPVRTDVPTDKLDACNILVLDDLKKPGMSVQSPFYIADTDRYHMYVKRTEPKIVFGSTDTGVPNRPGSDGLTFLDVLWDRGPFANPPAFVRAVEAASSEWFDAGRLTREERRTLIMRAGQAIFPQ